MECLVRASKGDRPALVSGDRGAEAVVLVARGGGNQTGSVWLPSRPRPPSVTGPACRGQVTMVFSNYSSLAGDLVPEADNRLAASCV